MTDELRLYGATEGTRLLGDRQAEHGHGPRILDSDSSRRWPSARYQVSSPNAVVGLVSFIVLCMALSWTMGLIPMGRLIEDVVCRKYYDSSEPVDERLCKEDEVQTELAWLGSLYVVVDSVIGFVVSFPWSIVSDRLGRKPVFQLSYLGLVIGGTWTFLVVRSDVLPVRLMLLSPLFTVFGGGAAVCSAVVNSIIADVTTERTSGFLWVSVGAVAGAVTGPGLSAMLMEATNPWVPLYITGCIAPVVILATVFLPETRPRDVEVPTTKAYHDSFGSSLVSHLKNVRHRLRESISVLRGRPIAILLFIFFIHSTVGLSQGQIVAQTISKRFHWSLAKTGYLFSAKGILMVVILSLMPLLTSSLASPRLGKYQLSVFVRDLRLAQLSLVSLIVGSVLMGGETLEEVMAGLVVSTFAIGLESLAKSLIASYVDNAHTSRLYAATGMTETAGRLFGAPLLAWTFARGVTTGWMGLPFFLVAVLCTLGLVALCFLQHPDVRDPDKAAAEG